MTQYVYLLILQGYSISYVVGLAMEYSINKNPILAITHQIESIIVSIEQHLKVYFVKIGPLLSHYTIDIVQSLCVHNFK